MLSVRPAAVDEWQEARRLRLEMLADSPHAFSDSLAEATSWTEDRWVLRHHSNLMADSTVIVAVDDTGAWVGTMSARQYRNYAPPRAWLLEVYLSPAHRSSGTAERILRDVQAWVLESGLTSMYLDVHEKSAAARRFYERLGFSYTGSTQPYPLMPSEIEYEMVKDLVEQPEPGAPGPN